MAVVNDLDLSKAGWKAACAELWTDSLWQIEKRDSSGAHTASYHGSFVPQIPRQFLRRFTKPGDWVIDPFVGIGTTLIEAQRLGRHALGIDLSPDCVAQAAANCCADPSYGTTKSSIQLETGDATVFDYEGWPARRAPGTDFPGFALAILHPPYHDIIRFSDAPEDLSNRDYGGFLDGMQDLMEGLDPMIPLGGHVVLVMGDKYQGGEWVPMGWQTAERIHHFSHDWTPGAHAVGGGPYTLKGVVVKDMQNSRAKQGQEGIWRYRALKGGTFVFRHEYLFLFKKTRDSSA